MLNSEIARSLSEVVSIDSDIFCLWERIGRAPVAFQSILASDLPDK